MRIGPIATAQPPTCQMAPTLPACSRTARDPRPPAAVPKTPSGRSRPSRIDPSTITSPTPRSWTQVTPGVRQAIGLDLAGTIRNHSPPPGVAANNDRFTPELRVIPLFHGRVERIHVNVNDGAARRGRLHAREPQAVEPARPRLGAIPSSALITKAMCSSRSTPSSLLGRSMTCPFEASTA